MSLRPFTPDSGRQSPFKRQNSTASARATTPTPTSPTKASDISPVKIASLSPEKTSPFVRRPSQLSNISDRSGSPFARPTSSLSISTTASRQDEEGIENRPTPPSLGRDLSSSAMKSSSPFDGAAADSPSIAPPKQPTFRSPAQRSERAPSTTSTIKPPSFVNHSPVPKPIISHTPGYNHISAPLLRSMRESFEVLDSSNTGSVTSASVASMLEQMGLPSAPSDVRDFFPPNGPAQLNLARYLDSLSGPLAEMSQGDELAAAFSAFDVDDSGQIDVAELRSALLNTVPERGGDMMRLSEREIDGILAEFTGRRAFGAKGINVAKGKGDVFRWREFMGSITGGAGNGQGELAAA